MGGAKKDKPQKSGNMMAQPAMKRISSAQSTISYKSEKQVRISANNTKKGKFSASGWIEKKASGTFMGVANW